MTRRYGRLSAERLGHLALEPEIYLCERDAGMHDGFEDVFSLGRPIANPFLVDLWRRHLTVSPWGPGTPIVPTSGIVDRLGLIERTPAHLTFTEDEHDRGRIMLTARGITRPFVAIHVRDRAHLDQFIPGEDWRYQDHRDADVANYDPAARWLAGVGYTAVRMGRTGIGTMTPAPGVIDNVALGWSDFLDVYLAAHCAWMLATPSGLSPLAAIFRRPVALTNVAPLLSTVLPYHPMARLFIPKLHVRDGRVMSVREIVAAGVADLTAGHHAGAFHDAGITLRDNTPDELLDLAQEMHAITTTGVLYADTENERQARFWDAAGVDPGPQRIGADFLRRHHKELLP